MLLAFLILILSFHFLIEDLSFSAVSNLLDSSYPSQVEITHQDDIVQSIELSSQIASNHIAHINPVLLPAQLNIFFPHFNPPNI